MKPDRVGAENGSSNPEDLNKVIQDLGGQPTGDQAGVGGAAGGAAGQLPGQYNISALQHNFAA